MSESLAGPMRFELVRPGSASEPQTGAMIALKPSEEDAARLAVDGGEDADELHVTLAYLGDAADVPVEVRERLVHDCVALSLRVPPQRVDAFGVAVFNPPGTVRSDGSEREPCAVLVLNGAGPGLEALHAGALLAVGDAETGENYADADGGLGAESGWEAPEQHSPWVPHITLTYDVSDVGGLADRTGPLTLDRLCVAFGDDYYEMPLGGDDPEAPASDPDADVDETEAYDVDRLALYSPDQLRVPVGDPSGGQFAPADDKAQRRRAAQRRPADDRPAGPTRPTPRRKTAGRREPARDGAGTAPPTRPLAYDRKTGRGTGYGIRGGDPHTRDLQEVLNRLGFTDSRDRRLAVDGRYGPRTTAAVRKLQRRLGLRADGVVTPELLKLVTEAGSIDDMAAAAREGLGAANARRRTAVQRAALLDYVAGPDRASYETFARGGPATTRLRANVERVRAALVPAPDDVVMYRRVDARTAFGEAGARPGLSFTEPGFLLAGLDAPSEDADGDVTLRLEVAEGTPLAYVGDLLTSSGESAAGRDVLLGPGLRYEVAAVGYGDGDEVTLTVTPADD